jgi:hypothetical protein
MMAADRHVMACNFAEAISECRKGALCYVLYSNPGGGYDRVFVLARSRGGRWIEKWEPIYRLTNFRVKTLPPEHPRYGRLRDYADWGEGTPTVGRPRAETLQWAADRLRQERSAATPGVRE